MGHWNALGLGAALIALTTASAAPLSMESENPASVGIPVVVENGWPVATATVDGHVLKFVVDTAAGGGVIDGAVAQRIGLAAAGDGVVAGASSSGGTARVRASTVEFAGRIRTSEEFSVADMSQFQGGFAGIIGNHIFKHYGFLMDVPGGRLELSETDLPVDAAGMTCVANAMPARNEMLEGFAIVEASIQTPERERQVPVIVVIDSGARRTQMNWTAGRALGLAPGDPRLTERQASRGLNGSASGPSTYAFLMEGFEIAGWAAPTTEVRISDLSIFEVLGLSSTPALILGADILNQRAFAISRGASQFCVDTV